MTHSELEKGSSHTLQHRPLSRVLSLPLHSKWHVLQTCRRDTEQLLCSWTARLLALRVHGVVPRHVHLMTVASQYVSIRVGSRVCVSLQRQPSFKERNGDAHTRFLQSAAEAETSPRRQKTEVKYLFLKTPNPASLAYLVFVL